jgi:hypothetical protein
MLLLSSWRTGTKLAITNEGKHIYNKKLDYAFNFGPNNANKTEHMVHALYNKLLISI